MRYHLLEAPVYRESPRCHGLRQRLLAVGFVKWHLAQLYGCPPILVEVNPEDPESCPRESDPKRQSYPPHPNDRDIRIVVRQPLGQSHDWLTDRTREGVDSCGHRCE